MSEDNMKNETQLLTYNGVTKTLSMWSRETGIPYATLYSRKARGLSDRQVLHGKVNPVDPVLTIGSWDYPLSFWSRVFRVKPSEIKMRLAQNLSHEHAVFGPPKQKPIKPELVQIGNKVARPNWWALRTAQSQSAVARRLAAGMSGVDAVFFQDDDSTN